jgi:pimeloyl-ACP methyl ester carboxylesterase
MAAQQQFTGLHSITLTAEVDGDPTHPAVVLLHGGGQTRHAWRRTTAALIARGLYTIALDLRGHGDSDWAPDGDYSLNAQVGDLLAVLQQLPSRPILIGASLGGLVALATVGEATTPIASALILVDVTPQVDPEGQARIISFMKANPDGFASVEDAAAAVAAYLPNRTRPSDPSGLRRNLRLRNDRYYWHWDPAFFGREEGAVHNMADRFELAARQVSIPTLLVRGSESELVKEENVRHFLSVIPTAEYVDVVAGHMVAGDSNDAFTDAVLTFIEQKLSAN